MSLRKAVPTIKLGIVCDGPEPAPISIPFGFSSSHHHVCSGRIQRSQFKREDPVGLKFAAHGLTEHESVGVETRRLDFA